MKRQTFSAHNKGKVLRRYIGHSVYEHPNERKQTIRQAVIVFAITTGLSLFSYTYGILNTPVELVSPIPVYAYTELQATPEPTPVVTPAPTPKPTPTPTTDSQVSLSQVEKIVRETFPEEPTVAVAVAKAESGLNPNRENRGKANGKYKGECSIGLFQINLRSDGCTGKKVHWDKVPGETLEEKVEWLKVPENNAKIARDIYDGRGGNWYAWGAYTNGSYKQHLRSDSE